MSRKRYKQKWVPAGFNNPDRKLDGATNGEGSSDFTKPSYPLDPVSRRNFLRLAAAGVAAVCVPAVPAFSGWKKRGSAGPRIIRMSPQNESNPVRLHDGSLRIYYMERNRHVASIGSKDNGLSWSDPTLEFPVSGETGYASRSLVDNKGKVHVWFLQRGEHHSHLPGQRHLDIWYSHTTEQGDWATPRLIWKGYCGALRDGLQMECGRIVVPFGAWKTGKEDLPEGTGSNYITVIFSDDGGITWRQSPATLTSPVYDGYNGNNYGACEPCITKLSDGRLWLLARTQTGFLYESFSEDGISWAPAEKSRFSTSNSPGAFVSLADGRTVVLWNNHALPPRINGEGVYGGRDGLHAAISDDSGHTWRGFREIYLDPAQNDSPPKSGDRGTAYPNGVATSDGHIILSTGQGERSRAIIRFHPNWLYETMRDHSFTTRGLEGWSVYKSVGPASNWWRDRKPGARLIPRPDNSQVRVLHIRRSDADAGDGAVWNFPAGITGTLTVKLLVNKGFGGAQISLADRLFDPSDDQGEEHAIFKLPVSPRGKVGHRRILPQGRWLTLTLIWDVAKKQCVVKVDGHQVHDLMLANPTINGISYLRLRSTAPEIDQAGILVEHVKVDVA